MKVIFRVDASLQIGTGHVMRCLTLAEALSARGAESYFLCREQPGDMIQQIRTRGFQVHVLSDVKKSGIFTGSSGSAKDVYQEWLGVTTEQDANDCRLIVQQLNPDWLVVDHYALDSRWETLLWPLCGRLMIIDDLADRVHECDVLLDQNWFGDETHNRYKNLVPEKCECLLGPEYALLRPEYAQLRHLMPPRDGFISRVLVFFGGSDPTNQTGKALKALSQEGLEDLVVDVVIGINHPDPRSISEQVSARRTTTVYQGLPTLAGLMARADLMVGAGGSTSWERMCLGLPCIVISIADNQLATNKMLMDAGYIEFIGSMTEIDPIKITLAVQHCLANPERLKNQSALMQELVSGIGTERICECIFSRGN